MSDFTNSEYGYDPCLALFERPAVNTGISSHKWVQHRPISQISNTGLLEFTISGTSSSYIDLKCSLLQIQGKIVSENGQNIGESDNVSFVNLPLHSLWRQVDLSLQQKVVSSRVGTNYAYKAYLDTILNSSSIQQQAQLTSQLFFKDSAGKFDKTAVENPGFYLRQRGTKGGKILQLMAPLCLDLCEQDRLLLNGVEINLKFWRNKPSFYLNSGGENTRYEFIITDAYLNVCMVDVSPAILVGHAAALKEHQALYPFHQSDIKTVSIGKGMLDITVDNIFQGDIPSEVLVGLVPAAGFNGDYKRNPFNFLHFNCNFCGFYIDGESIPTEPFQPNFPSSADEVSDSNLETSKYAEAYMSLFGQEYFLRENIPISFSEYPFGYCLYKFNFTENNTGLHERENFLSIPRRGHSRLVLKFEKALEESVNVIIYARFPRIMKIDESRNVIL